jgi:tRNA dimethylallyltransferase
MTTRTLIAVVGPTATGKTSLAIQLAARLGGEIVGADSRQAYRRMDIGTAKPSPKEQAAVPHHLINVVDPDGEFSLGRWLELALEALDDIWSRRKRPLLVGGTGQYVWALLEGWRVPRVPPQPQLRGRLEARDGPSLFEDVRRVDPEAAARIGPANRRRLIRALEVFEVTGRPISFWQTKEPPRFESPIVGLRLPRDELYRRIDARVDRMIETGLIDETRHLLAMGYSPDLPSMSGIGYKEACAHLAGELTIDEAATRIKTETHRLARRQSSWFKPGDERIHWLDGGEGVEQRALVALGAEEAVRGR